MDVKNLLLKEMELSHISGRIKSCAESLAVSKLALEVYLKDENNQELAIDKIRAICFLIKEAEAFVHTADNKLLEYEGVLADAAQ